MTNKMRRAKYVFNSMPFSLAAPKQPRKETIVTTIPMAIAAVAREEPREMRCSALGLVRVVV